MKNKKYMKYASGKIKWLMFQDSVANFFRILFGKKVKESRALKRLLMDILERENPARIPEYLGEAGFSKMDNDDQPPYADMKDGIILAVVNKSIDNLEIELSVYSDVVGFEDRFLITCFIIDYSKGFPNPFSRGMFCDKPHKTKKKKKEVKSLIQRLSLASQYS